MRKYLFGAVLLSSLVYFSFSTQEDKTKKIQLLLFEGSDWCGDCRRLEKNVLADSLFIRFLSDKGIALIRIDFPQRKKISAEQKQFNAQMAKKFSFDGVFPTLLLYKTNSLVFKKINYTNQSVAKLIAIIQRESVLLQ